MVSCYFSEPFCFHFHPLFIFEDSLFSIVHFFCHPALLSNRFSATTMEKELREGQGVGQVPRRIACRVGYRRKEWEGTTQYSQ